jgi:hypothetical protein
MNRLDRIMAADVHGHSRTWCPDLRIRSFGQCQRHIAGPSDASSRFRMCHLAKRWSSDRSYLTCGHGR